ncbi:MAG TPA: bifunctional phosphopantothenoylcysteine decarboxylase/phosphopantothenate--cysteine ligase CoaBC [Thermoplasmataceae archaeon]|nr:bifunctional phosphopantothenoylcysteine decarboxylase/phosphopantothenate--cysteine ligase CoaBC [Thermoplasmataceae archaeon]
MLDNADRNRFSGMLKGKRVVVAVTASISLYRVPDLIRDLRREGAQVFVGMSEEAASLISPKIMRWASGNEVTTELTGEIEHITLFEGQPGDTVLSITPCTHNTLGKIANGISDDVPSSFYSFAAGNGNKVVLSPAMHEGMYRNPSNRRNADFLTSIGVDIVPPEISEEKAKLSANAEIIDHICRAFYSHTLSGKKVIVIGGHTEEPIDPVRSLSNHGTGFTAYWFARSAFRLGASRITYVGNCTEDLPSYTNYIEAETSSEIEAEALKEVERGYDIVLSPAAISDFRISGEFKEKISSSSSHQIKLEPRGKIIDRVREKHKGLLIPFNLTEEKDLELIREKFKKSGPEMIVSNSFAERDPFGETFNDYEIIKEDSVEELNNVSKPEMTLQVLRTAAEIIGE